VALRVLVCCLVRDLGVVETFVMGTDGVELRLELRLGVVLAYEWGNIGNGD